MFANFCTLGGLNSFGPSANSQVTEAWEELNWIPAEFRNDLEVLSVLVKQDWSGVSGVEWSGVEWSGYIGQKSVKIEHQN